MALENIDSKQWTFRYLGIFQGELERAVTPLGAERHHRNLILASCVHALAIGEPLVTAGYDVYNEALPPSLSPLYDALSLDDWFIKGRLARLQLPSGVDEMPRSAEGLLSALALAEIDYRDLSRIDPLMPTS